MQEDRVRAAIEQMEQLNIEEARQLLEQVLIENPRNVEAIDHYTDLLEQVGEVDKMEALLKTFLNEENRELILIYQNNYKLLFKYAQTQHGKTAIQYYLYGIQLLEKWLTAENKGLIRDMADAHAAVAEIYQTDLLQLKESECECVKHINLSFQYDPQNLDAFLQLANYHLNKEDECGAKKELRVIYERLMSVSYEEDSYDEDFKLQVAKVMVEVEDYQSAYDILSRVVEHNERNGEVLYMLAFSGWKLQKYGEALKLVNGVLGMDEMKEDQVSGILLQIFEQEIYSATQELQQELLKMDLGETQKMGEEEEWMDVE